MNRNHVLMLGAVILMLGVQLRMVDTYVLNSTTTTFLTEKLKLDVSQGNDLTSPFSQIMQQVSAPAAQRKAIRPPRWLGWAFLSVGAVVMLHSLAMRKPGG